jgi:hypothetical protein
MNLSTTTDFACATGNLFTAGSDLPEFNDAGGTAFIPAPTTPMGAFTNLLTQQNDTYPVSQRQFERQH